MPHDPGRHRQTDLSRMRAPFSIQVVSDLHLESPDRAFCREAADVPPVAPYLALLGDIGDPFDASYSEFAARQSGRFRRVFVVLGNHEWYGSEGRDCLARARDVAARLPNVHVLEKEAVEVDGVRVLGTTLWSEVDYQTACCMNDFYEISGWTHRKALDEHRACVDWLTRQLREHGRPTVVLTHHAPMLGFTSPPRFAGSDTESGFATDLGRLVRAPVVAWFHGHTHWSHERVVNDGVLVASNAAGFVDEDTRFDPARVFVV